MRNRGPKQKKASAAAGDSGADARLMEAVQSGSAGQIRAALKAGADPNTSGGGSSALIWAAGLGAIKPMELLVAAGADVNARGRSGSALASAAQGRAPRRAIAWLLAAGADPNRTDWEGNAPAHELSKGRASLSEALAALESLFAAGANPDLRNKVGNAPIHVAASVGFLLGAQLLERAGADMDARGALGLGAQATAAFHQKDDVAEWLAQRSSARSQARAIERTLSPSEAGPTASSKKRARL